MFKMVSGEICKLTSTEVGGWVAWTQVQGLGTMSLFPAGLAGGQVRRGER